MRSDAIIIVTCDKCGYEEQVELCALAGGGWDERYVDAKLEQRGWNLDNGEVCETCIEEEE